MKRNPSDQLWKPCLLLVLGVSCSLGLIRAQLASNYAGKMDVTVSEKFNRPLVSLSSARPSPSASSGSQQLRFTESKEHKSQSTLASRSLGGLGLAISSRNRISLGHISKQSNSKPQQGTIGRSHSWPESSSRRQEPNVNMRVMSHPIDIHIIKHLQPDVSPLIVRKLRKILANGLDKNWTSDQPPRVLRQRGVSAVSANGGSTAAASATVKLVREAQALNMTFRDNSGSQFLLPEAQVQLFRTWLIEQATCEMEFVWEDLGPLFWPRWIRRGVCLNNQGRSCSWPPGMKCHPSGSRALQLLHWKCETAPIVQQPDGQVSRSPRQASYNRNRPTSESYQTWHNLRRPVSRAYSSRPASSATAIGRADWQQRRRPPRIRRRDEHLNGEVNAALKKERQKRRARRLIKKLSITSNGYHCHWQVQKFLISDRCTCSCT